MRPRPVAEHVATLARVQRQVCADPDIATEAKRALTQAITHVLKLLQAQVTVDPERLGPLDRSALGDGPVERGQARLRSTCCSHVFHDSHNCIKCGWVP